MNNITLIAYFFISVIFTLYTTSWVFAEPPVERNSSEHVLLPPNFNKINEDAYHTIKWNLNPLLRDRPRWPSRVHKYVNGKKTMDDPHIVREQFTIKAAEEIWQKFHSATGNAKTCLKNFTKTYADKVIKYCQHLGSANYIAGGCYHVVKPMNTTVYKHALLSCNVEINS